MPTYQGQPVYGFENTGSGNPTDSYGRNVYLDTFNSRYGSGWKRENGFLSHRFAAPSATASTLTSGTPCSRTARSDPEETASAIALPWWAPRQPGRLLVGSRSPRMDDSRQNDLEERMNRISNTMMANDDKCQRT